MTDWDEMLGPGAQIDIRGPDGVFWRHSIELMVSRSWPGGVEGYIELRGSKAHIDFTELDAGYHSICVDGTYRFVLDTPDDTPDFKGPKGTIRRAWEWLSEYVPHLHKEK